MNASEKSVLAVVAHPDDIEFIAAGTMLLLKESGWQTHYLCLSGGDCGSVSTNQSETRRIRREEAIAAAGILGAIHHDSLTDDLLILYDEQTLRKLAAVIRLAQPNIVLTHSPDDYMEDHMNTSRLAVTASFTLGMPNFETIPQVTPVLKDLAIYHGMPHGLCDGLRRAVVPGGFVDTSEVHSTKIASLAAHASQKQWLDVSQGMNSYLVACNDMSLAVGRLSGRFEHAEGWRRHLHLGYASHEVDPLAEALGKKYFVNQSYEDSLVYPT